MNTAKSPPEPTGFASVQPDIAYPIRVYCRLFSLTYRTAVNHIAAGKLAVLRLGDGRGHKRVLGSELLRLAGLKFGSVMPPSESLEARERRGKAAAREIERIVAVRTGKNRGKRSAR